MCLFSENTEDCALEIRKILSSMPESNRRLLRHVASFLRRAARRDAKKRSDVEALGTAFAPCLFRCDNNVTSQRVFTSVATQMVLNFHLVFPECSDDGLAGWVLNIILFFLPLICFPKMQNGFIKLTSTDTFSNQFLITNSLTTWNFLVFFQGSWYRFIQPCSLNANITYKL